MEVDPDVIDIFVEALAGGTGGAVGAVKDKLIEIGTAADDLVPMTQAKPAADNTSAVTPPNTGGQTIGNISMTITKSKHVPIRYNG